MTTKPAKLEGQQLSSIRKAAMLMVILGEGPSSQLMQHLTEEEVQKLSCEVAKISSISPEQGEGVLEEFHQMSTAGDYVSRGGMEYARKLVAKSFDPEHAKRLLDRLSKAFGADAVSFDAIQKADPQQLAKFIHNEHPQTIALVLSHLNYTQAAALLTSLPTPIRADVSMRMASLDQISPEIIVKIAGVIGQKLKALGEFSRESYGGVRAVAELLNRLDSNTSRDIIDNIELQNANLAETIRHLMFVFEDILLIDAQGIKEVLAKADRKQLTIALKGTSEQLRNHFLSCMSQRGSEMLREDMEAMGPTKIKDVEAAQQLIIALVRQLESEGVISLKAAVGEQSCKLHEGDQTPAAEPVVWRTPSVAPKNIPDPLPSNQEELREQAAQLQKEYGQRIREAHAAGLKEGDAAGCARATAEVQPVIARLASAMDEVAGLRARLRAEAEADLVQLSLAIARRVLRREIGIDPEALHGLVLGALHKLQGQEIARVRVHPSHVAAIAKCLQENLNADKIQVIADPSREIGAVIFETQRGNLDASVDSQLQEIEHGLADRLRNAGLRPAFGSVAT